MSKWKMVRLGDVCIIERGGSPRPIQNYITSSDDGINWIKIGDTIPNSMYITNTKEKIISEGLKKSRFVHKGDFLLSNSMSFGRPYILEIDGCIHDGWLLIRDGKNSFDKKFLYYYLSSSSTYLTFQSLAVGGVVNNLNSEMVRNLVVPLPPLDEQKRIADVLDKASELIKKRKEQIRLMDELAKSLFIEMFGDPVENPMGWEIKLLGELGAFKNGINYGQKDTGYLAKILGVGDFKSQNVFDNIDSLSSVRLTEKPNPEYFLNDGDIIFVRSNGSKELVGRNIIIYPRGKLVTFSGFCIRFRVLSSHILPSYLQNILLIPSQKSRLLENGRGCNIQNLNQQMLSSINIPLPPLELQKAFVNRIEAIEQQKALLQEGIAKMETAYKALMQEYFG